MTAATNYTVNKFLVDTLFRATPTTVPATLYYGLFIANKGLWIPSTPYVLNDQVIPATGEAGHVYVCTTAGTSGSSAPAWPTAAAGTVTDGGTLVWTEMTTLLKTGTFTAGTFVEASYTGYARVAVTASLANWASTQGNTSASTGITGVTSNLTQINFGAPTSSQAGLVVGMFLADVATVSTANVLYWSALTNAKTINNGDAAPNFPVGAFTMTWA
jgi:hypothetical protein